VENQPGDLIQYENIDIFEQNPEAAARLGIFRKGEWLL
jgi:hypothetical protein